ncbi:MAG: translation initiation factor IF-2 [Candidatus Aceula meridiana]|nr:translation initiation factor IF-2 [Candidatus Aceula meridiana]
MKVSELAKEYGMASQEILAELKAMKLKSKDAKQDLSSAAVAVLRSALAKKGKKIVPKAKGEANPATKKEEAAKTVKKAPLKVAAKKPAKTKLIKKSALKKTPAKKAPAKKASAKKDKPAVKKAVVKKPEKKEATPKSKVIKEDLRKKTPGPKAPAPKFQQQKVSPPRPPVFQKVKPSVYPKKTEVQKVQEPPRSQETVARGPQKDIEIDFPISVKDLSVKLQQKLNIVLKFLMKKGIFATINQNLGEDIVEKISQDLNFTFRKAKTQEEELVAIHRGDGEDPALMKDRPPVITFMGHVDHGKTSLLDKIRRSNITDKEHGGITQHMAAYSVKTPKGIMTFLDTPGHAAFTAMRARGAHITDLIILVVAADEGIMPQTEEAIDHARAANVPIVVAINKIDKRNADIDRVKKQLSEKDLMTEDWGGKVVAVGVSATTGDGVDKLLEMILLEAELLELKANYEKRASGIIVEAHLSPGKGAVSSIIVQSGTLKEGDIVVAGPFFGKVKAMFDDHQQPMSVASPAIPVEILGLSGVPEAGEIFYAVSDEKQAKEIAAKRLNQIKNKRLQSMQKITLEDLYSQIQEGKIKELNIILKADVQGSLGALKDSLEQLSTDEVKIKFIHIGIGDISAADVILAGVANAIVVGFHVNISTKAKDELEKQDIDVRIYRIIYDAVNDLKNALSGLLEPRLKKIFLGRIEVRQVFKLTKSGMVAGCFVQKGKVHRKAKVSVTRNGEEVFKGDMESLKRFKDDVREVREGFECGITIKDYDKLQVGDIVEAYELERIERSL